MVLASRGNDPPPHFKPMPHYTTWGGTYVTRPVAIEDRDYSDNDYDFNDFVIESTQADALTDNLSGTAGPGGSTFLTDSNQEKAQLMEHAPKESEYRPEAQVNPVGVGYTEVEWTHIGDNLSGTAGPGGSTFSTGYAEAIGLDSSTLGLPVLHSITAGDDAGGIAISES